PTVTGRAGSPASPRKNTPRTCASTGRSWQSGLVKNLQKAPALLGAMGSRRGVANGILCPAPTRSFYFLVQACPRSDGLCGSPPALDRLRLAGEDPSCL